LSALCHKPTFRRREKSSQKKEDARPRECD
jgi:hypothetical protein